MKTKSLLLGIVTLLAAGGWWVGQAVWRAHRQLVSLDVRNAPLAEVLRKIERQTWKKIRAEKALDARITLHVADKPLPDVLDRIAEQAGARWSTLYAVYGSKRALEKLDSALRGDGKIAPAGWTTIAPNLPDLDRPGAVETGPSFSSGPNPGAPGPMRGRGGMMMVKRGAGGPVVFQGGPSGQVEMWSPEELVLESQLRPRLGNDGAAQDRPATAEAASETARKVDGRWTTYLAFRKSSMGVGFGVRTPARHGSSQSLSTRRPKPPELGGAMHGPGPNSNERFDRLTPEQRVQRARARRGFNEK
ncbi:MAG: hypothetical protein HY735_30205 [Verrucomicrobia bacterium]|nr:hypothetical protein [Verrucomicrobiota bacterium]